MSEPEERRGSGCSKAIVAGCLSMIVLAIMVTVGVILNFERIRDSDIGRSVTEAVAEGQSTLSDLMALQGRLRERYEVQDVGARVHFGSDGRTLEITFVDPPIADDASVDLESWAREAAGFVRRSYGGSDELDRIGIVVSRTYQVGIQVASNQQFLFDVAELPAADSDGPATEPEAP